MAADNEHTRSLDNMRLSVYVKPCFDSEIVCEVDSPIGLIISDGESTEDFYKVYTAYGAPGYCRKDQVFR